MEAFRQRARDWIAENLPDAWRSASAETHGEEAFLEIRRTWARMLHDAGWLGLSWPEAYGGRGLSLVEEVIFAEEEAEAQAPNTINRNSVSYIGPTLIVHGTEAQKTRHLPGMLSGEEVWCQAFSEPDAGSDVASLRTSATRRGDGWVVSG